MKIHKNSHSSLASEVVQFSFGGELIVAIVLGLISLVWLPLSREISVPKAVITLPDQTKISAFIADTPALQQKGLSGRSKPVAMLFVNKEQSIPKYWMKDMHFPIDLIWIDGEMIVGLLENLPPENPSITRYSPNMPIDRVLEVPVGFIKLHTLTVGDLLDITLPKR